MNHLLRKSDTESTVTKLAEVSDLPSNFGWSETHLLLLIHSYYRAGRMSINHESSQNLSGFHPR